MQFSIILAKKTLFMIWKGTHNHIKLINEHKSLRSKKSLHLMDLPPGNKILEKKSFDCYNKEWDWNWNQEEKWKVLWKCSFRWFIVSFKRTLAMVNGNNKITTTKIRRIMGALLNKLKWESEWERWMEELSDEIGGFRISAWITRNIYWFYHFYIK